MRIVLPLIGTGTDDDPIRVDMPTYAIIRTVLNGRAAVVDVPDDDGPDPTDWPDDVPIVPGLRARMLDALTPTQILRWRRRLDARYEQHAGRHKPIQGM